MEILKRRHYSTGGEQAELDIAAVCATLNCSPSMAIRAALRAMARLGSRATMIEPVKEALDGLPVKFVFPNYEQQKTEMEKAARELILGKKDCSIEKKDYI